MNRFNSKLAGHGLTLRRGRLQTLQINVGRKCNQTCTHCHVDAAPWRTEMMSETVARRVGEWIHEHRPKVVDITGGAPELSDHFCYFVETARACGCHVIDRNNLTIIETPAFGWLPDYLARHEQNMANCIAEYEHGAAHRILDTTFANLTSMDVEHVCGELTLGEETTPEDVIRLAVNVDTGLSHLYREAAEKAASDEVRQLFETLHALNERETRRMVRDMVEVNDL